MRTVCIALFLGALAVGSCLQGSFLQLILTACVAGYLVLPGALILAGLAIAGLIRGRPAGSGYRRATETLCALIVSLVLAYAVGSAVYRVRLAATRTCVAKAVPVLDEIDRRTGKYPAALPAVIQTGWDYRLSFPLSYLSAGTNFDFSYDDPAGLMDSYELNSSERSWRHHG